MKKEEGRVKKEEGRWEREEGGGERGEGRREGASRVALSLVSRRVERNNTIRRSARTCLSTRMKHHRHTTAPTAPLSSRRPPTPDGAARWRQFEWLGIGHIGRPRASVALRVQRVC